MGLPISRLAAELAEFVELEHLSSCRFDRQTEAVQLTFAVAQMAVEQGASLLHVDGLIENALQTKAVNDSKGPRGFFSQRCHDKGLTCRRIIFLDGKSTQTFNSKTADSGLFHFHGFFLLEPDKTEKWLRQKLRSVFGTAGKARIFQFKLRWADKTLSHSFGGQKGYGSTGKLAYVFSHVGTTCNRLKLNDGQKRSRKPPLNRARVNSNSCGIARGIPSNFVKKVIIWDTKTRRIAKQSFDEWLKFQKSKKNSTTQNYSNKNFQTGVCTNGDARSQ